MSNETTKTVEIGPIPFDPNDRANKFLYISVNGKTIMLDRGMKHRVPKEFAEAYEHRMVMQGRRIRERDRMEQLIRNKQNTDGVSFM